MQELQKRFKQYTAKIGQNQTLHTTPQHDGSAHVDLIDSEYFYVVTERGRVLERRIAKNEDEILYWLISDLVFDLASQYELKHRVPGRSFRRVLFSKRIELMEKIKPEWAERTRQDIQKTLQAHPYNDETEG